VVEDLIERVVGAHFAQDALLPNEPDLCSTYNVSRTVVREAVKFLETMRLVRVVQGSGTSIRPFADWDLLSPVVLAAAIRHDAELSILQDLIDVRTALESQMAAQAAERATDDQLAAVTQAMSHLHDLTNDPVTFLSADRFFHDTIWAASGNRIGRAAMRNLNEQTKHSGRYIGEPTPTDCIEANISHQKIHDRLIAHDSAGTHDAMILHITASWQGRRPSNNSDRNIQAAAVPASDSR